MKNIKRFLFILGAITFLYCFSNCILAEQDGHTKLEQEATTIFPETKSWELISKMPELDLATFQKIKDDLKKSYLGSPIAKTLDRNQCSFIDRAFANKHILKKLNVSDIDGDGNNDIIYTGSATCLESNTTLIWYGSANGYYINQYSRFHTGLALRVKKGKTALISSFSYGCCGDMYDTYNIASLPDLNTTSAVIITKSTKIPTTTNKPQLFSSNKELILRDSPIITTALNEEASSYHGKDIFGNIISKYSPGCTGIIIGTKQDKNSTTWYFIKLDETCNSLRTYSPFKVNAGWTSSKIKIKQSN